MLQDKLGKFTGRLKRVPLLILSLIVVQGFLLSSQAN